MKKLLLCVLVLLMQGCSGAVSQPSDIHMNGNRYEIEQDAQLHIYMYQMIPMEGSWSGCGMNTILRISMPCISALQKSP